MAASHDNGWSIPWPAIITVATLLSGTALYLSGLKSSRPDAESGADTYITLGEERADARLWQDPFKAAFDQEQRVKADPAEQSTWGLSWLGSPASGSRIPFKPPANSKLATRDAKVLVFPVFVNGGAYAELAEQRLRTRVAVLEGLGVEGYQPVDGEHIGYFTTPWISDSLDPSEISDNKDYPGAITTAASSRPLTVPYEWCEKASVPMARFRTAGGPDRVLVLWLNEESFSDVPLVRLSALFDVLRTAPVLKDTITKIAVLGPRTSTGLRAMALEASQLHEPLLTAVKTDLREVSIYSATPTADDQVLLEGIYDTPTGDTPDVADYLSIRLNRQGQDPLLERTVITDRALCDTLVGELSRRGVQVHFDQPSEEDSEARKNAAEQCDPVAIVSEWDTVYGRALPMTFASVVSNWPVNDLTKNPGHFPRWVYPFVYLRGIDGRVPGDEQASGTNRPNHDDSDKQPGIFTIYGGAGTEGAGAPEGLNQTDYLKRLADHLAQLDETLRREGRSLKAVGVLGTDVYDKLLILKALRPRLPGVLFFTTGIDARYGLREEWPDAHNLVMVSPFGLRLHEYYQRNIPPFRDSYQTGVFAATLRALGQRSINAGAIGPARIFEVGRDRIYDLTVDEDKFLDPAKDQREDFGVSVKTPQKVHPPRYDLALGPVYTSVYAWPLLLLLAALLLAGIFAGIRPEGLTFTNAFGRIATSTFPFVLLASGIISLLCWWIPKWYPIDGEPFSLLGGVSIWPTEGIRLLAAALCVHLIFKGMRDAKINDKDIQSWFHLDPLPSAPTGTTAGGPLLQARVDMSLRMDDWQVVGKDNQHANPPVEEAHLPESGYRVYAQNLWWEFQRRSMPRARWTRVIIASVLYGLAAFCVVNLFGLPPTPSRGTLSAWADSITLAVSILTTIVLSFYVLDATYLNTRFIRYLGKTQTHYPDGAFSRYDWKIDFADLTEYLDIRLIAMRTQIVGDVIYYPFYIFLMMIVARTSLFANWSWPAGLILVLTANLGIAIFGALMLRSAAEEAREEALRGLRRRFLSYTADDKKASLAKVMAEITKLVKREQEGAFSILSQHPLLAAVVLPTGSLGIWVLVEYLPKLVVG